MTAEWLLDLAMMEALIESLKLSLSLSFSDPFFSAMGNFTRCSSHVFLSREVAPESENKK